MPRELNKGWRSFIPALLFTAVMWLIYLVNTALGGDLHGLGIMPRTLAGMVGIVTAPFIHADLNHITSNTVPLLVVGTGLFYFYGQISWNVFFMIYFMNGFWVWMAARTSYHIGASGIIYGLVCFMFFSGLLRRNTNLLAISLLVTFLYGSMVWGILPVDQSVSWESHLFGAAAGIFAAVYYRKQGPQREKYSWELEEEQEADSGEEANKPDEHITIHYDFRPNPTDDEKKES